MNTAPTISRTGRHRPPPLLERTATSNRSGARIALGTILVVVTTLVAIVVYGRVGNRAAVLAVARTVEVGQTIAAADLAEVRVSTDSGLRPMAASDRAGVVGRVAAVALVPGTLLTRAQLGDGPGLAPGTALVGAVLKPGQAPLGIRNGQHVWAVVTPSPGTGAIADTASPAIPPVAATLVAVENLPDAGGAMNVSLAVPAASAPALAIAAGSARLSIVVVGR